jgi:hypothetical protein
MGGVQFGRHDGGGVTKTRKELAAVTRLNRRDRVKWKARWSMRLPAALD